MTADSRFLKISQAMLGVYLIHPLFIGAFYRLNFSLLAWNPLLSAPAASLLFFLLSLIIVLGVRKIPFIRGIF